MTRKDYQLIAACIRYVDERAVLRATGDDAVLYIVDQLCEALAENNPRFSVTAFRKAALVQAGS